jgi:hypothetical protein
MRVNTVAALTRLSFAVIIVATFSSPAAAQFQRAADPAVGERYHVEVAGILWSATPDLIISSESLGIPPDDVDLVSDLGIESKRLRELRVVLRPAPKHKFRLHYTPIKYEAQAAVTREFVFNGQRYRPGILVATTADFTTVRGGYEYDFFYSDRGYAGVIVDLKYTNVDVALNSPIGLEFVKTAAPIPGIGFAGRGYLARNVSVTGELTFMKVPENLGGQDFGGRYIDFDLYGTANFNDNVGAQVGYKAIDVDYFEELDAGTLTFKGLYFGGVVRF